MRQVNVDSIIRSVELLEENRRRSVEMRKTKLEVYYYILICYRKI